MKKRREPGMRGTGDGRSGVLNIYKTLPGGNHVQKHKAKDIDVVGEVYPNQLKKLKREKQNCIASKHDPNFLKLPKRNGANLVIFQPKKMET